MSAETKPTPLHDLKAKLGSLDEFRVDSAYEIDAILNQLCDTGAFVTLSAPGGVSYTTLMWTADADHDVVVFTADANDPQVPALLDSGEASAMGYLDSIKVQFELDGLVLVRGADESALHARYPRVLYRFQRRSAFRVRPLHVSGPVAQMRHPAIPDMTLDLRILDISLSGVALFLPTNVPPLDAGVQINRCVIDLDADTRLDVGLYVHHVTALNPESRGVRLGCEMTGLDGASARALQRYIDYTQKHRSALGRE